VAGKPARATFPQAQIRSPPRLRTFKAARLPRIARRSSPSSWTTTAPAPVPFKAVVHIATAKAAPEVSTTVVEIEVRGRPSQPPIRFKAAQGGRGHWKRWPEPLQKASWALAAAIASSHLGLRSR